MAKAARDLGAVLHAGSIVERAPGGDRGPQGRGLWNTSVLFGPAGERLAVYRKIHRFGFGAGSRPCSRPATRWSPLDVALGGTASPPGLATCYDLRFPELFRRLVDDGARLVLLPAAWPVARIEHGRCWAVPAPSRTRSSSSSATPPGPTRACTMAGRSQVVDATGPCSRGGRGRGGPGVDVDLAAVDAWRERFPVLADRRL